MLEKDIFYMKQALAEAKKAYAKDEVPVGAVMVLDDRIVAKGYNQVELLQDATAHAEMLALSTCADFVENWRLIDATIYTTLEPCVMCAGAIIQCRVKRVVWGAKDIRLGANGSFVDLFAKKHPIHQVEIVGGVLEAESADLLRAFFQKKRKEKKCLDLN